MLAALFSAPELAKLTEVNEVEFKNRLEIIKNKYIIDMDGVIYHGSQLLPGAKEFVDWLIAEDNKYLFLTNNSTPTPKELSEKLAHLELDALSLITKDNAKLIGTNPDTNGVKENGECVLGTGAFLAALEVASGKKAFTCGKPSSLMMAYAQSYLGLAKEKPCIIGDRMDTDILAGTSAQIDPVLVMSGVTNLGLGQLVSRRLPSIPRPQRLWRTHQGLVNALKPSC
ncbi:UNVERIFIED_CONTAM: hypothetical protein HDU68_000596 [Siphonaria sp. JEL0065]|nr:hypothetical protein HDU68_000596 [Siphonaria sp. JEL0065]